MFTLNQGKIVEGMDGWYVAPKDSEAHYVYEGSLLCGLSWYFGYDPVFVQADVSYCPQCLRKLSLLTAKMWRERKNNRKYGEGDSVIVNAGHFEGRAGTVKSVGLFAYSVLLYGDKIETVFHDNEIEKW